MTQDNRHDCRKCAMYKLGTRRCDYYKDCTYGYEFICLKYKSKLVFKERIRLLVGQARTNISRGRGWFSEIGTGAIVYSFIQSGLSTTTILVFIGYLFVCGLIGHLDQRYFQFWQSENNYATEQNPFFVRIENTLKRIEEKICQ